MPTANEKPYCPGYGAQKNGDAQSPSHGHTKLIGLPVQAKKRQRQQSDPVGPVKSKQSQVPFQQCGEFSLWSPVPPFSHSINY